MAAEQLNFQGINRAVSDYGNAGACEELINLRPTTQGLVPVKPFSVKMAGVTYEKVIEHKTGSGTNYICFKLVEEDEHYSCQVWQIDGDGDIIGDTPLASFYCDGEGDIQDISYGSAGNILFFSDANRDAPYFKNVELIWNGSEYKLAEADIPDITPTITPGSPELKQSSLSMEESSLETKPEIASFLENAFNEIQESNKEYCFGPVIIALAFKTTDGNTFWTSKWMVYDPIPAIKKDLGAGTTAPRQYTFTIDDFNNPSEKTQAFFQKYTYGYRVNISVDTYHPLMAGVTIDMTLPRVYGWDSNTSTIRSVEIYATRPQLHFSMEDSLVLQDDLELLPLRIYLPQALIKDMGLGDQLFYLQKSVPMNELSEDNVTVRLSFGGNIQTTNKTLEVDAGAVTRYGKFVSYNARFHFYDSVAEVNAGMPWFSEIYDPEDHDNYPADVFLIFNDGQKDTMMYAGSTEMPYDTTPDFVISPDVRVKEVIVQIHATPGSSDFYQYYHYAMAASSRYNYSFSDAGPSRVYVKSTAQYDITSYPSFIRIEEPSAINVTEQYNPFVFRVEHSYLAPGKVLDIQPQMVAVRDVSFGDYPLDVFTDKGVYALLQGSGTVLYGNFRSISSLITGSNSIPTENGTFFLASGGLWAVAGSKSVLVSDALHLGPHKFIRDSVGFRSLSMGAVYDVTDLQSDPTFEVYVNGNGTTIPTKATLSYNRYRDEIYVSNPSYPYTYALSLKYRQWFKLGIPLAQDVPGSTIVSTKHGTATDILDFSDETENTSVLVHLQSRPFSFGYMYSHIHRIVSMVRANLSDDDVLVAAIYGSDDLQQWFLLSYAARSDVKVSQLRTPPAARSWRYYTVCIGGTVPTDTDFGPVMVDYQPVVRRMG